MKKEMEVKSVLTSRHDTETGPVRVIKVQLVFIVKEDEGKKELHDLVDMTDKQVLVEINPVQGKLPLKAT